MQDGLVLKSRRRAALEWTLSGLAIVSLCVSVLCLVLWLVPHQKTEAFLRSLAAVRSGSGTEATGTEATGAGVRALIFRVRGAFLGDSDGLRSLAT